MLHTTPHNLPIALTSFIGRQRQLDDLVRWLETARLVTLAGPGGSGKTRLALQLATRLRPAFSSGTWLVQLAPVSATASLWEVLGAILGVKEEAGRSLPDAVSAHLAAGPTLLVMDNCEHVLRPCANVIRHLLQTCPDLRILTTSREVVRIPGELVFPVGPLSVPPLANVTKPADLISYESAQLFVDRARYHSPSFAVTHANAPVVLDICRRLEGIPLAIELAASRLKVLSLEQIATRLSDQFRLLSSQYGLEPPHQQTLRSTLDWSYGLLTPTEQKLLGRMSLFRAGCDLDAVEAVCAGNGIAADDLLDLLGQLVDKSWLSTEERAEVKRYRMLEIISQYARERLQESGVETTFRNAHLRYCLTLARKAEQGLIGTEQLAWLTRLDVAYDNLLAALGWAEESGQLDEGLELGAALWRYWARRGRLREGWERLNRLLVLPGAGIESRARALNAAGLMAELQGNYDWAVSAFEESINLFKKLGWRRNVGDLLGNLGNVARKRGDYAGASELYQKSLRLYREVDHPWTIALLLFNLGAVAHHVSDHEQATRYYGESLTIRRELGDKWGVARSLSMMGEVALTQGDTLKATAMLTEALPRWRALEDTWGIALCVTGLGVAARRNGEYQKALDLMQQGLRLRKERNDQPGLADSLDRLAGLLGEAGLTEQAAILFGASSALRTGVGLPIPRPWRPEFEQDVTMVRSRLEPERSASAWTEGGALDLERAVSRVLSITEVVRGAFPRESNEGPLKAVAQVAPPLSGLSRREWEIVRLVAQGLSDRQIAAELAISARTVDAHLRNIFRKLNMASRTEVAIWAIRA